MSFGNNGNGKLSLQQALEIGIDAVNRGEYTRGKAALTWVLQKDPHNAAAWLWMACCVTDDQAKDECYRRVSDIENNNG